MDLQPAPPSSLPPALAITDGYQSPDNDQHPSTPDSHAQIQEMGQDGFGMQHPNKQLTSRYRGVCWNKKNKRWQAAINSSGRYLYLGSFVSEDEAAKAFDRAAIKIRGKKAKCNFNYNDYVDASGNLIDDERFPALPVLKDEETAGNRKRDAGRVKSEKLADHPTAALISRLGQEVLSGGPKDPTPFLDVGHVLHSVRDDHSSSVRGSFSNTHVLKMSMPLGSVGGPSTNAVTLQPVIVNGTLQLLQVPAPQSGSNSIDYTLEGIVPSGRDNLFCLVYRSSQEQRLMATLFDGTSLHDLGAYSTEKDIKQVCAAAIAMTIKFRDNTSFLPPLPTNPAPMSTGGGQGALILPLQQEHIVQPYVPLQQHQDSPRGGPNMPHINQDIVDSRASGSDNSEAQPSGIAAIMSSAGALQLQMIMPQLLAAAKHAPSHGGGLSGGGGGNHSNHSSHGNHNNHSNPFSPGRDHSMSHGRDHSMSHGRDHGMSHSGRDHSSLHVRDHFSLAPRDHPSLGLTLGTRDHLSLGSRGEHLSLGGSRDQLSLGSGRDHMGLRGRDSYKPELNFGLPDHMKAPMGYGGRKRSLMDDELDEGDGPPSPKRPHGDTLSKDFRALESLSNIRLQDALKQLVAAAKYKQS